MRAYISAIMLGDSNSNPIELGKGGPDLSQWSGLLSW